MAERYLCVSIDTECDKGAGWRVEKPLGFAGIHEGVGARLAPLFRKYSAKATYLLSPEVIRDEACRDLFARLKPEAELGTHLHGELAEPDAFVPDVTSAFQRDYSETEERKKLESLTRDFENAFGEKPKSFRAGRFGIGRHTIPILESLGYAVESSVAPFTEWSGAGAPGLDFRGAPTQPYHPDPHDAKTRGTSAIWEVPLTIRPRALSRMPVVGRFVEPAWLRPTHGSGDALVSLAREECAEAEARAPGRPIVLCAMFHNVEVVPGKSPYAKNEREARAILSRLETLLSFCEREGIAMIGLADAAAILEERQAA
jgi:hypothetical protein